MLENSQPLKDLVISIEHGGKQVNWEFGCLKKQILFYLRPKKKKFRKVPNYSVITR